MCFSRAYIRLRRTLVRFRQGRTSKLPLLKTFTKREGFFCSMSNYVVYILFSTKYAKIYIGFTSNLIQRFYSHNFLSKKGYTARYRPWKVIHVEFFDNKSDALKRERFLKSGQGRYKMDCSK